MPSPVNLTPEQVAAFEAQRLGDFCTRVRDALAARPATFVARRLPLSWFEERVGWAEQFGITVEQPVAKFLEIILRAGDEIVRHPEIAAILSAREEPEGERVMLAEERVRRIVNG